jgi:hypothetical protein
MAKATLKTQKTEASVTDFLETIADEQQRTDSKTIVAMMQKATGDKPKMWGPGIIGFGNRLITYENGREQDWFKIGFSPRKAALTLYGVKNANDDALLKKLGKYTEGKGCLYIKRLSDVDATVLKKMIEWAGKADWSKRIFHRK